MNWIIFIIIILIIIKFWNKAHRKVETIFIDIIDNSNNTSKNLLRLFNIAIYVTIIVLLINLFFNNFDKMGEWGDFFGGVLNPLLTFLTFMGLLITIILQQKEFQQSRKEFRGQKESLENQEFDNKFFQMLNLFNNTINNLDCNIYGHRYYKREVIQHIHLEIVEAKLQNTARNINTFQRYQSFFNELNNEYDTTFKYYFINLYQILKYIDRNSNTINEAKEYTNIVRAQLSKSELILLFYNAIGVIEFSQEKYKELVEKYALFEHLRYKDLNPKNENTIVNLLLLKYDETAFGNNCLIREKIQALKDNKTE